MFWLLVFLLQSVCCTAHAISHWHVFLVGLFDSLRLLRKSWERWWCELLKGWSISCSEYPIRIHSLNYWHSVTSRLSGSFEGELRFDPIEMSPFTNVVRITNLPSSVICRVVTRFRRDEFFNRPKHFYPSHSVLMYPADSQRREFSRAVSTHLR